MNAFFNVIKREIEKIKGNKFIQFNLFIAPLFLVFVVVWTFSAGTLTKLPVAVLDCDNSDVSRLIIRAINSTPSVDVRYKLHDIKQGQDLMRGGKVYGVVVFPENFKKDLTRSKRPQISYYYNNQIIIVGGTITKDIQSAVLTTIKGIDAQIRMKQGLSDEEALARIAPVSVDERVRSNPYLNYSYFLVYAAIAHVFQIFITFFSIWTLGVEFREGTTKEWLKCANNSIITAVFGKLFTYGTVLFGLMFLSYFGYIIFYQAPYSGHILFCLFSAICYIFSYQMMGLAFVAILSNLRFAISAGAFYTSLGFSFAGMTFPAAAMPLFGRMYSSLLPVRPFVNLLVDQVLKGFKPHYDLIYVFWMLCIGLVGVCLIPLLKKHSMDEKLWYQI